MITIQGVPFKVALMPRGFTPTSIGEMLGDEAEILVAGWIPRERQEQTFWHEVLHGLGEGEEALQDEGTVTRVANALYAFLSDNELLRDGWFEDVLGPSNNDEPWSGVLIPLHERKV